jgi:isopenicillin N synthase-like dioxygenase
MRIPTIDVSTLFERDRNASGPSVRRIDAAICEAACDVGFMTIVGLPFQDAIGPAIRDSLVRVFAIPEAEQRKLWKKNFAPENPNLYRGWFPRESAEPRSREGYDIGPDLVRVLPEDGSRDLLYEPSSFPPDELVPGWRDDAARYYEAMSEVGRVLLASISRGIGIPEEIFADAFRNGISTLRLVHYPARDPSVPIGPELEPYFTRSGGRRAEIVCGGHFDTGLVTILGQCGVSGLQAQAPDGEWVDIPPTPDGFVINFGGLLARWTGGRIRATKHRVLSSGGARFSIPFFFEPRPDAVIAPLPIPDIQTFEPFQFGDHLWATTTQFPENYGLGHLRPARAPYRDPFAPS